MTRPLALVWGLLLCGPMFGQVQAAPRGEATDDLRQAVHHFQAARQELQSQPQAEPTGFGLSAAFFERAASQGAQLTAEQEQAWAYCRLRTAADKLNRLGTDPRIATEVLAEATQAEKLVGNNANLKKLSSDLIQAARQRGATPPTNATTSPGAITLKVIGRADGWEVLETDNFRIRHTEHRTQAEQVIRAAEVARSAIFQKWSGPASGAWKVKCELLLHADANSFKQATKQPAEAMGHAWLKLEDGQATERRVDLRADDPQLLNDSLPRELTYIVLGDLFWDKAPPKWAELGMAVLASSATEVSRYRRSLSSCAQDGQLCSVKDLLAAESIPADRVTGYYIGSVNLVDFLVKWKGAKTFTSFLRDAHRYGQAAGLQRHYGVRDPQQLQQLWLQGELTR